MWMFLIATAYKVFNINKSSNSYFLVHFGILYKYKTEKFGKTTELRWWNSTATHTFYKKQCFSWRSVISMVPYKFWPLYYITGYMYVYRTWYRFLKNNWLVTHASKNIGIYWINVKEMKLLFCLFLEYFYSSFSTNMKRLTKNIKINSESAISW